MKYSASDFFAYAAFCDWIVLRKKGCASVTFKGP